MSVNRKCICYVALYFCSFALAQPSTNSTLVELTYERRPEVGWVVTCSWNLVPNDHLQAVFLHRDDQLFANYRPDPKYNGAYLRHTYSRIDDVMELTCDERESRCTLVIEPVQPPRKDINITCEVSGEGPMFRVGNKSLTIETVVTPSDAIIEVSKASEDSNPELNGGGKPLLNCSSTGVPAPRIEWTVGDENTEITSFHSTRVWNATSKLWYSWSTLLVSDQLPVRCIPKVSRGNFMYSGRPAQYSIASRIGGLGSTHMIFAAMLVLIR